MARLPARVAARASAANSRLTDAAGSRPIVITYLGFRLIEGIIARTPRRLAYAIGVVTSTLAFPLLARQRKALESHLHHVLPEMPGPQLRKLAWRNWLYYTTASIAFFKIPPMDRRKLGALLTPSRLESLAATLALGT